MDAVPHVYVVQPLVSSVLPVRPRAASGGRHLIQRDAPLLPPLEAPADQAAAAPELAHLGDRRHAEEQPSDNERLREADVAQRRAKDQLRRPGRPRCRLQAPSAPTGAGTSTHRGAGTPWQVCGLDLPETFPAGGDCPRQARREVRGQVAPPGREPVEREAEALRACPRHGRRRPPRWPGHLLAAQRLADHARDEVAERSGGVFVPVEGLLVLRLHPVGQHPVHHVARGGAPCQVPPREEARTRAAARRLSAASRRRSACEAQARAVRPVVQRGAGARGQGA
mmetsp:Transcript_103735/g.302770  ORF Transcript_103735/g.302770 Transcript_103735/m.302770 type:complete len:282 (-) Transcript_103735:154-999(-)